MKHIKKFNHLSRKSSERSALLSSMACSLIKAKNKRITTTVAKAKALRVYVEPLLTKSKDDSTNSRRVVFSYLQDKEAVTELFREVSQKIASRNGGYTVSSRLASVWVMLLRCVLSSWLIMMRTCSRVRLQQARSLLCTRRSSAKKKADEVSDATVVEETPSEEK